jgi:glycosyltransferase involved in cell wall biosynthesis
MQITHAMPVYAPAWKFGGPVLSVSRLCEALAREGVSVRVLTTNAGLPDWPAGELSTPILQGGVEVIRYPVDRQGAPIRSRALEQALPEALAGSQLLHLSAIWQPLGPPLQRAALAQNIPVLHSLRGALGPYSLSHGWWKKLPYLLLLERPLLQRAAGLHVTSRQEARELDWLRLRAPRQLLPNPLDLTQLRPEPELRQRWRQRLAIPAGTPLLLVCGRQHHKKGLDLLPALLASQRHQPWRLLLVGGDDDGSGVALRLSLQQRGLGERLLLEPTMPAADLVGVYNAADLLLLPSRHENFGNVVVEALACGCAVLISDRTGVGADLLEAAPPDFGAVLPRRAGPWRAWLAVWLRQPQRAGAAAAAWAGEHYGQHAVARRAIELYRLILQTQASTPAPR